MILILALAAVALLLAIAVWLIARLAITVIHRGRHIDALAHAVELEREAAEIQRKRADVLATTVALCHERIGDLADRNALLERVQKRNLRAAIIVTPVLTFTDENGEKREVCMN